MALDPTDLPADVLTFLGEYHLASLTTARPDGSPHVVPVGFSYSPADGVARVITWSASKKARNVAAAPGGRAVVCQVDGGRWLSLPLPSRCRVGASPTCSTSARRPTSSRSR